MREGHRKKGIRGIAPVIDEIRAAGRGNRQPGYSRRMLRSIIKRRIERAVGGKGADRVYGDVFRSIRHRRQLVGIPTSSVIGEGHRIVGHYQIRSDNTTTTIDVIELYTGKLCELACC